MSLLWWQLFSDLENLFLQQLGDGNLRKKHHLAEKDPNEPSI